MQPLDRFRDTLTDVSRATRVAYLTDASQHLQWLRQHDLTPYSVPAPTFDEFTAFLAVRYQPATVARKLSAVRRFYAALRIDVGDALQTPPAPPERSLTAMWDDLSLPPLDDPTGCGFRDRAILALSVLHRLPATAISRLTWPDLDIDEAPGLLRYRFDLVTLEARAYRALSGWQRAADILLIESKHVFVTLHDGQHPLSPRGVRAVINKYHQ